MAKVQLLPGFGSKYTSETIAGAASPGTIGADEIDVSRCAQFAIQVLSVANAASSVLQVEQSFDGANWATLGTTMLKTLGNIMRFGAFSGPYGKIRLKVIDAAAAVTVTYVVVGFEMQGKA